jgi:hypothetical protein
VRGIYRNVLGIFAAIVLAIGAEANQDLPKTFECKTKIVIITVFDDNRLPVRSPSVESTVTIDFASPTVVVIHSQSIQDDAEQSSVANYRGYVTSSFYEFQPNGARSSGVTGGLISIDRRSGQFHSNSTVRVQDSTVALNESGMCRQITSVNRF